MTTAQTTTRSKTTKETSIPAATAFADYLDTLSDRHEKLVASLKDNRDRARRISEELTEAFLAGQRDLLGLARQLAGHPADLSANAKVVMDTAAAAQERSLALGKLVYTEQAQAGAEVRKLWEAAWPNKATLLPNAKSFFTPWFGASAE